MSALALVLAEKIRKIRQEAPAKRAQFLTRVNCDIISNIENAVYEHFKSGTRAPDQWCYLDSVTAEIFTANTIDGASTDRHDAHDYNVLMNRVRVYTMAGSMESGVMTYPRDALWYFEFIDLPTPLKTLDLSHNKITSWANM